MPWAGAAAPAGETLVTVAVTPLAEPAEPCLGRFVAHEMDHITSVPGDTVDQFETNGSGVAIGDLDNDGDLDVVLGNHAGPNTIHWNQGNLEFRAEAMPHGETRSVALVDVDGDGWLDIVFTRRTGGVTYWRNTGAPGNRFVQETLPGVSRPAYAMLWADMDQDGDLDFVTGSYDAGLLNDLGNSFLLSANGGVILYENREGRFVGRSLASSAQAMAIALFDADRDGRPDLVVGNDFAVPDYLWLQADDGWQRASFDATSHSTMSLDAGDIDNDGVPELFSSDMLPYAEDAATVAAWDPIMAGMTESYEPGDPQVMSNVLQVWTGTNGYQNAAAPRGVDATGWTWSSKFGDLDQDGLLDLYAVNGFAEKTLFAHLPNHELVEENQALRNVGEGYFWPAPAWGLGSTHGGRGMSLADLDGDGDLDSVVNNLRGPAQLFENRLCGGRAVQVDLRWQESGNIYAIGAQVTLHTSAGAFTRDVRSGSGYLSGDPPRLHFGVPAVARLRRLEVRWPDGATSTVGNLRPNTLVTISREESQAAATPAPSAEPLPEDELRALIVQHGLTGDPSLGRDLPGIDDPLAQLGMKLFFSKALSGDLDVACATCHHPLLGGGDGLPVSIGVGAVDPDLLGPGRAHVSGQANVPRNAPTTFNIGLWDQALFHDGRAESLGKTTGRNGADGLGIRTPDSIYGLADSLAGDDLVAAQSRFPVTSREEMRGWTFEAHRPNAFVRSHLCARLDELGAGAGELGQTGWLAEFQRAFASDLPAAALLTDANLAAALSAYQRSQIFVDTPWRAFVQGDEEAIDAAARRGARLFFRPVEQGGAGCAACHRGDFFTDEQFYTLAVPQVGPGKRDGRTNDDDYGRFRESGRPEDLYTFRTPTLLNVAATGPYGHDGAYAMLEEMVRHHLDPAAAVAAYDPTQLGPAINTAHWAENTQRALAKLAEDRRAGRTPLQDVALSDAQVADLVSFLHALTDPCVLDPACLAPWIPGEGDGDPDGLRVRRPEVSQRMENSE